MGARPEKLSVVKDETYFHVAIVTMDTHLNSAAIKAKNTLKKEIPGLSLEMFAASEYASDKTKLNACIEGIKKADIVVVTMLFIEEHFHPIIKALEAKRKDCDAMVCIMSAPEVSKLTSMGRLDMSKPASGAMGFLQKLRGNKKNPAAKSGESQMRMLRRLPKILKYLPGTAQDLRIYLLTLQYWLAGSEENIVGLVCNLVNKYSSNERLQQNGEIKVLEPIQYPSLGVYHPRLKGRISEKLTSLPRVVSDKNCKGTVGLIVLRSYLLSGNSAHYDGVIAAIEAQGLRVIPVFAMGLDSRPAIEKFFFYNDKTTVDMVVSLTGFSLVGGPAYNDAKAAEEILSKLDVPYLAAHPVEFQTISDWNESDRGLLPVENTIMVAIPELDGAISPMIFGGRPGKNDHIKLNTNANNKGKKKIVFENSNDTDMVVCSERAAMLAERVEKLVSLRKTKVSEKKVAIVLFNYPPNAGNIGTAAHLGVFESLQNTLKSMKESGYTIELPESSDKLREKLVNGNSSTYCTDANVAEKTPVDDYVLKEKWLDEIENCWGAAPGKQNTNGKDLFVLGAYFGNVFVGIQPGFGYEGDPMKLLFEKGHSPTHSFSNFYRFIREDFNADAILHFGTHGALEFMPGKQSGMSESCWPDRLISSTPNFYLYASNNPSEGAIAKRRAAATLISYMTPPICEAGLYKSLHELKSLIDRYSKDDTSKNQDSREAWELTKLIFQQTNELKIFEKKLFDIQDHKTLLKVDESIAKIKIRLHEYQTAIIPYGLHVLGKKPDAEQRFSLIKAMALSWFSKQEESYDKADGFINDFSSLEQLDKIIELMVSTIVNSNDFILVKELVQKEISTSKKYFSRTEKKLICCLQGDRLNNLIEILYNSDTLIQEDNETTGILKVLQGRYIHPAPGGDILNTPEVLPTGRNLHGFDPFRLPSSFAVMEGAKQADKLLERIQSDQGNFPESVAIVLWGTDNLKTEGCPIAQALWLMGAKPRFDSYGRLAGAELVPLEILGRPRVDVMVTLSGIFRDLLPLQIKTLAEAAFKAASVDEPEEQNFIRAHALKYMTENQCDIQTASLRVFGNCDGAYGSNINFMIDQGTWEQEDELAEAYTRRKGFAYGTNGKPVRQEALMQSIMSGIDVAYQNLDSVEVGVTTIDTYFDTLGGISRAVKKAKGDSKEAPIYIGDHTKGEGVVRSLAEQVSLETRTRVLNPKWYEGMLNNGYEGVRQIEAHLTHTLGWSATTGQVQPWVYEEMTKTFILDTDMRSRLADLNPTASAKVVNRLLEASRRKYWKPSEQILSALEKAGQDLEDKIEGITEGITEGVPS
jgi:magnesium chelatase subunit H